MINIVSFDNGEKYAVDVGFGGDGPTKPLPLTPNIEHVNLGAQEVRYLYAPIAQFQSDHPFWIYQYRNGKDREWHSYYCFVVTPFLDQDFEIMSYFASSYRNVNQFNNILLVKFLRTGSQISGKRMIYGTTVRENTGGKTITLIECQNERERVDAFKRYFGITLLEEEITAIKGRIPELPS